MHDIITEVLNEFREAVKDVALAEASRVIAPRDAIRLGCRRREERVAKTRRDLEILVENEITKRVDHALRHLPPAVPGVHAGDLKGGERFCVLGGSLVFSRVAHRSLTPGGGPAPGTILGMTDVGQFCTLAVDTMVIRIYDAEEGQQTGDSEKGGEQCTQKS